MKLSSFVLIQGSGVRGLKVSETPFSILCSDGSLPCELLKI
jgi:hypothetical protein